MHTPQESNKGPSGTTAVGTEEQVRLMEKLRALIVNEAKSGVDQQIAIELLTVSYVCRFGADGEFIADSINKHVKQLYRGLVVESLHQEREASSKVRNN
jgi:hypothetical protein